MDDITIKDGLNNSGNTFSMPQPPAEDELDRTLRADGPVASMQDTQPGEFILGGETYHCQKTLSDNSGEAHVYLVCNDNKEYVLKIYYPNVDIKKEVLKVVANIDFDMIVRLYDFGNIYVDGKKRSYELMEYLRGGTLVNCCLGGNMDAFRRIALQAAAALACCHKNNVIHKDIKPSNFFFRDDKHTELVLGDFGISSVMTGDGNLHRTTQARTPVYAAPEMYNDVIDGEVEISPAADYYSLGITLLALWLGTNPLNTNERMIMKLKSEGRLPGVSGLPERVRMIIQGLTAVKPASRWTYDEVEKWFLGGSPKVDVSSPYLKYRSFVFDPERNLVADNVAELIPLLMENERTACVYLYSGKIAEWLEQSGNLKLSIAVDDIVKNRYPADQHAGLMVAVYTMEPEYPYMDVKGNLCGSIHDVVIALLDNADEYAVLLRNRNDRLWLYVDTHCTDCNVDRMRSYFHNADSDGRKSLMRVAYELEPEMPLLANCPSSTLSDIVHSFGYANLSDDDWLCLTDGRLLSWMYSHEDNMACESLRIMTEGKPYSKQLAYQVLYNIDRNAAYDLREADTPQKVGELLAEQLGKWQYLSDEDFAECISEYSNPDGRFCYFAQLHGWAEQLSEAHRCFDLNSNENRERLGVYNLRTAAYRLCRSLGVVPFYLLAEGVRLADGLEIDNKHRSGIRTEIRSGCFIQWLSVFYHENPNETFYEAYSYERALEQWINAIGEYDAQHSYYKRFVTAKDVTARKYDEARSRYRKAKTKEGLWRVSFYGLCVVWVILLLMYGINDREYLLANSMFAIGIPVGGVSAIIVGARAFFRGYGFLFTCMWGILGFFTSLIPVWILKQTEAWCPSLFVPVILSLTVVYMAICHFTEAGGESKEDNKLISEILEDDVKSTLIEPLYYTFRTKSYRFKGSKFGIIDDIQDRISSVTSERVLHYVLWSIMIGLLVIEMVLYSPGLLNMDNPGFDTYRKAPAATVVATDDDIDVQ